MKNVQQLDLFQLLQEAKQREEEKRRAVEPYRNAIGELLPWEQEEQRGGDLHE